MTTEKAVTKSDRVRASMLREDYDFLLVEAERNGQTISGYLRSALARNKYIDAGLRAGDTFLVERAGDGRTYEIIFK